VSLWLFYLIAGKPHSLPHHHFASAKSTFLRAPRLYFVGAAAGFFVPISLFMSMTLCVL